MDRRTYVDEGSTRECAGHGSFAVDRSRCLAYTVPERTLECDLGLYDHPSNTGNTLESYMSV